MDVPKPPSDSIDYLSALTCGLILLDLGAFADVHGMVDWVMACALPTVTGRASHESEGS